MVFVRVNEREILIDSEPLYVWVEYLQEKFWDRILIVDYVPSNHIIYFTSKESAKDNQLIIGIENKRGLN